MALPLPFPVVVPDPVVDPPLVVEPELVVVPEPVVVLEVEPEPDVVPEFVVPDVVSEFVAVPELVDVSEPVVASVAPMVSTGVASGSVYALLACNLRSVLSLASFFRKLLLTVFSISHELTVL